MSRIFSERPLSRVFGTILHKNLVASLFLIAAGPVLANPADLDAGFGSAGMVVTDVSSALADPDVIYDIAIQPDGRIVAAGATELMTKT